MKKTRKANERNLFELFASRVTKATGTTPVFISAFLIVLGWAVSGPFFNYSETWQLVINTGTTIVTFLMVFLIQKTQNKDSLAIHLKLNELVASSRFASNRLVDVEDLTEEEMEVLKKFYTKLSDLSEEDGSLIMSHSIDGAQELHREKRGGQKRKLGNNRQTNNTSSRNRQANPSRISIETIADNVKSELEQTKAKPKRRNSKPRPPRDGAEQSGGKPKSE
jgi:low affinity Fe/Cu permease